MNKTSKKDVKKVTKKTVLKTTDKKINKEVNKSANTPAKERPIPTLESILNEADKAFTDVVKNYLRLGDALVKAITFYGAKGKRAFKTRFPLTDNALDHLELVGRGRLLPQFAMCSDRFVSGIVNISESLKWQYKLLGASKKGMIRIRTRNGKIVDAKFEDLRKKEIDGVLSIISEEDKDLSPEELCDKIAQLNRQVVDNFEKGNKPLYVIKIDTKSSKTVVRFTKSHTYTRDEIKAILDKMDETTTVES